MWSHEWPVTSTVLALPEGWTHRRKTQRSHLFVPLPNSEASLSRRTSSSPSGLASLWVMFLRDRAQKHRLMHECEAGPSTVNKSPNSQSGEQLRVSWNTREQGRFPLVLKAQRNQCCLTNSAGKHISTCMSSFPPLPLPPTPLQWSREGTNSPT